MRRIRGIQKPVSELVFGCDRPIMQMGGDNGEILDAAYAAGITFYDTGRCYGDSEISLGNWIRSRGVREQIVLQTKGCHPKPWALQTNRVNAQAIREDLETSLKNLQTDYVDSYLLHRDDPEVPVAELIGELEAQRQAGKLLVYGVSNWTLERFQEAASYAKSHGAVGFQINSPHFSLAEMVDDPWQSGSQAITLSGPEHARDRQYFLENKIPIVPYSSLGRGLFSGKFKAAEVLEQSGKAEKAMDVCALRGFLSADNLRRLARVEEMAADRNATVPQIALAYLLNQELEVYPICSYTTVKHMEDNLKALEIRLTPEDRQWLNLEN